jgi:hypothetical protein
VMLRHSGGHVVPGDPHLRNSVAAFLQERARDAAAFELRQKGS